MRRTLIGMLVGGILVVLAWGLTVRLLGPFPGITKANVERIRSGMSWAEVKAILGEPAPDVDLDPLEECGLFMIDKKLPFFEVYWHGEAGKATVSFTNYRQVIDAAFEPARDPPFSVRLRSFLGL